MSYLVFARKWRPKDFDEVVGQEHVTKTLKSALTAQKLAHAYLFTGPQGVGKTSCARILAKALNCDVGLSAKPCGACSACREIAEGRSLDVLEIDGASNRGIDEIRSLRENVKFAPVAGRYKIYIIDEVHMLTPEAFNALLKTLEEPPPYVKFIFATTQPQKVLPTILSRCQRFDFIRIPNLEIVEKLKEIVRAEGAHVEEDVFLTIARAADGSMRDAETILDQLIAFSQKDIKLGDAVLVLGIIEQDVFLEFADAIKRRDAAAAVGFIAELLKKGRDLNNFLEGLLEHYRNLMVLKIIKTEQEKFIDLPGDTLLRLSEQASRMTLAEVMTAINHIFAAQDLARKMREARIPLEVLAVKLASVGEKKGEDPQPAPQHAHSVFREAAPPAVAPPSPAPMRKSAPETTASEKPQGPFSADPPVGLDTVKEKWGNLIQSLAQTKMSLATYLQEAQPCRVDGGVLAVGFPKHAVFFKEAMTHKDNMKILENAVKNILGAPFEIRFEIRDEPSAEKENAEEVADAPLLKSALDTFKGKVVG